MIASSSTVPGDLIHWPTEMRHEVPELWWVTLGRSLSRIEEIMVHPGTHVQGDPLSDALADDRRQPDK